MNFGTSFYKLDKSLGLVEGSVLAHLFGHLVDTYNFFNDRDDLEDGAFYQSGSTIEQHTGIKRKPREKSIKRLLELGFIYTEVGTVPNSSTKTVWYYIDEDEVAEWLEEHPFKDLIDANKKAFFKKKESDRAERLAKRPKCRFYDIIQARKSKCPKGTNANVLKEHYIENPIIENISSTTKTNEDKSFDGLSKSPLAAEITELYNHAVELNKDNGSDKWTMSERDAATIAEALNESGEGVDGLKAESTKIYRRATTTESKEYAGITYLYGGNGAYIQHTL